MQDLMPIIYVLVISMVDILLLIGIKFYSIKYNNEIKKNKEVSRTYSHDIIIGTISGMIVVVIDKVITLTLGNIPKIDFSSVYSIIGSLMGVLLIVVFICAFLTLAVIYLLYLGIKTVSEPSRKPTLSLRESFKYPSKQG